MTRIILAQTAQSTTPNPKKSIEVLSIMADTSPGVIAVLDMRIGGIRINRITITDRGRGSFINYPRRKISDSWVSLVEITSPPLRVAVEDVIVAALARVGR